jgi:hypothetical protein
MRSSTQTILRKDVEKRNTVDSERKKRKKMTQFKVDKNLLSKLFLLLW